MKGFLGQLSFLLKGRLHLPDLCIPLLQRIPGELTAQQRGGEVFLEQSLSFLKWPHLEVAPFWVLFCWPL